MGVGGCAHQWFSRPDFDTAVPSMGMGYPPRYAGLHVSNTIGPGRFRRGGGDSGMDVPSNQPVLLRCHSTLLKHQVIVSDLPVFRLRSSVGGVGVGRKLSNWDVLGNFADA